MQTIGGKKEVDANQLQFSLKDWEPELMVRLREVGSLVKRGLSRGNTNGASRIQNPDLEMIIQRDNVFSMRRRQSCTCQTNHIKVNERGACRWNPEVSDDAN